MTLQTDLNIVSTLIERLPNDGIVGSPALQVRGGFVQAQMALEKLIDFISKPDDMLSDKANALKIEAQRTKFQEALKIAADRAAKTVDDLTASQLARQVEAAQLVENEHAAEIRSVYRGLSSSEKADFMAQALKTDDKPVIAALTNPATSPLLVGISGEQMRLYRTHYMDKFLPADSSVIDNMRVTSETLVKALSHI